MLPESEGQRFFTINLHLASKSGSPSVQGDARPPSNLGVAQRTSQVEVVAVSLLLSKNPRVSASPYSLAEIRQVNSR